VGCQGSPGPAHTASPAWKGTLCDVLERLCSFPSSWAIEIHLQAGVGGRVMQSPTLSSASFSYTPRDLGKSRFFLAFMPLKDYYK